MGQKRNFPLLARPFSVFYLPTAGNIFAKSTPKSSNARHWPGGFWIVLVEQDRGEPLPHVPFSMAGQYAQEDMRPDVGFAVDEMSISFPRWHPFPPGRRIPRGSRKEAY